MILYVLSSARLSVILVMQKTFVISVPGNLAIILEQSAMNGSFVMTACGTDRQTERHQIVALCLLLSSQRNKRICIAIGPQILIELLRQSQSQQLQQMMRGCGLFGLMFTADGVLKATKEFIRHAHVVIVYY